MKIAETRPETIQEYQKSQLIRLIDVVAIGPVMIYAGTRKELSPFVRYSLLVFGIATVYYNAKNYLINEKRNHAENPTRP
jgi:hypothetical protein